MEWLGVTATAAVTFLLVLGFLATLATLLVIYGFVDHPSYRAKFRTREGVAFIRLVMICAFITATSVLAALIIIVRSSLDL